MHRSRSAAGFGWAVLNAPVFRSLSGDALAGVEFNDAEFARSQRVVEFVPLLPGSDHHRDSCHG